MAIAVRTTSNRMKVLALVAGCLLLSACSGGTQPTAAEDSGSAPVETVNVKVGVIPVAEFVPVYIAHDEGFFEEEGLAVETQVIQNAASIAPSVLNGQLQFGTAAISPFISAVGKNLPLLAVANGSSVSDDPDKDQSAILVMPDSGIETPADLVGKTVAVNALGSISHVTAAADVDKNGADHNDVTFVAMPFPDMIAALQRGTIDAAVVVEPFMVQGINNGAEVLSHPNSETLTPGTFTVLFTSRDFAAKDPETVAKFQRAMNKASKAAAGDPALVERVLVEHLKLDQALVKQMRTPVYSDGLNVDSLQAMADMLVDLGFMDNTIDAAKSVWTE